MRCLVSWQRERMNQEAEQERTEKGKDEVDGKRNRRCLRLRYLLRMKFMNNFLKDMLAGEAR